MSQHPIEALLRPPVELWSMLVAFAAATIAILAPWALMMPPGVAYGASASFLTPYGYTTNLMVQNLGQYSFADYFRSGLPMSIVYSAVVLALVPVFFPFNV